MKVFITGSNGLLGQKIIDYCLKAKIDFLATSKGVNRNSSCPPDNYFSLDITDEKDVNNCVSNSNCTHIIHTAAITNVDFCELNPEEAEKVNVTATKYLINAANNINAHFQFISTDFVFDGLKGNYTESDTVNPISVYAQNKVDGELLLQNFAKNEWSIVRTIIVYGHGDNLSRSNLIDWAKGALEKQQEINIIDDQFRAPTFAEDLAEGCMLILEKGESGIFNICGPETNSIFEIVERIADYFNYSMEKVNRISSKTLSQPASRPPKTGLDLSKSRKLLGYNPKSLEESLDILYPNIVK